MPGKSCVTFKFSRRLKEFSFTNLILLFSNSRLVSYTTHVQLKTIFFFLRRVEIQTKDIIYIRVFQIKKITPTKNCCTCDHSNIHLINPEFVTRIYHDSRVSRHVFRNLKSV